MSKPYVPKTLVEQAYQIGREHGRIRGERAAKCRVKTSISIPLEFDGHAAATAAYLEGQDDGFFCALDLAAAKERRAEVADMIDAGAEEMDRLEGAQ